MKSVEEKIREALILPENECYRGSAVSVQIRSGKVIFRDVWRRPNCVDEIVDLTQDYIDKNCPQKYRKWSDFYP